VNSILTGVAVGHGQPEESSGPELVKVTAASIALFVTG